jgi:4-amino-4-deoxy-L-arabinose transferase-like glycosyltransferase
MYFTISTNTKKEIGLFFGFFCVAVVFRFWTFFQSGLDWDESLYMLVSQSILDGNIPYISIWDNKPVGIYLLYVLAFLIFGKSVFSIRLLSCITIAITCYVLYRFGDLLSKNGKLIGLIAALIYIVFSLQNGGDAANTEIFFIPFVSIVYYSILSQWLQPSRRNSRVNQLFYFAFGFLLGIAFIIKYVVIYDLVTTSLLLIIVHLFPGNRFPDNQFIKYSSLNTIRDIAIFLSGFILPFSLMSIFFMVNGHFSDFLYANFTANKIRNIDRPFSLTVVVKAFVSQLRLNMPLWIFFGLTFLSPFLKRLLPNERRALSFLFLWVLIPLLGIFLTFKVDFYAHYFLQLLPPLSLITSFFLVRFILEINENQSIRKRYVSLLLSVVLLTSFHGTSNLRKSLKFIYYRYVKKIPHHENKVSEVADYIQAHISTESYIYVADYDPVVYFLSNARIPTKYAYPFFLMGKNLPKVAGVNPSQELYSLMNKKPLYIILSTKSKEKVYNRLFYSKLKAWLKQDYILERFDDEVKLYRRKVHSNKFN